MRCCFHAQNEGFGAITVRKFGLAGGLADRSRDLEITNQMRLAGFELVRFKVEQAPGRANSKATKSPRVNE